MKIARIALLLSLTALVAACAQSVPLPPDVPTRDLPGFWWGLLHGIIVVFSFIGSLFNDNVAIYAVHNSGGWYDFGFILGCGAITFYWRN